VVATAVSAVTVAAERAPGMVLVPGGSYTPLYRAPARDSADGDSAAATPVRPVPVEPFLMDVHPVTNAEYLAFVRQHPEWRRSRVKRLLADESYLRRWSGDLEPGAEAPASSPVVEVSWFAARAYCAAQGKRLPTVDQWEYAAAAGARARAARDPDSRRLLADWYARPTPARLPAVGSTWRNLYGVEDLHGLVWEWTLDFNSALVTGESRGDASLERSLYCGGAAANASDFENYPAFMRFAFRSSLEARYCVANLGFRGVRPAASVPAPGGEAGAGKARR
jgi:formylglycine-generating enzyme required for sulfatase activity